METKTSDLKEHQYIAPLPGPRRIAPPKKRRPEAPAPPRRIKPKPKPKPKKAPPPKRIKRP